MNSRLNAASPPPVVTTYLLDTFTEAGNTVLSSHVSDDGHTWAGISGQAGVFTVGAGTGTVRPTVNFPRYISNATTPDDWIAEVVMRRFSSVVNDQGGAYLNLNAASTSAAITGYQFRFMNSTLSVELNKLTASVVTQAVIAFPYTPPDTSARTYKLVKVGANFEAFIDAVSVATGTDSGTPFVGARIGLVGGTTGGASAGTHISQINVHS